MILMRHLAVLTLAGLCAMLTATAPAAAQTASPAATQRADIETLQRLYNERFVATPFAGLYQIDRPIPYSPRETAPILVTRDGEYSFNNGKLGAQHGDTGAPLSGSEWGALVLRWRDQIRYSDLIQQGGNGPLRMLLLSAYDCPFSKKLEAALAAAGTRYAIIPSTIGTANKPFLPDIWCSPDRAATWRRAIGTGALPPRASRSCRYDRRYFETLSGMFGGSKPTALFADGTIVASPSPAFVKQKLATLSRQGIAF